MDVLCTGLGLVESPSWHEGRLWFSDWIAGEIMAVDDAGTSELIVRHESLPLCFDFRTGGQPVLVSNRQMARCSPASWRSRRLRLQARRRRPAPNLGVVAARWPDVAGLSADTAWDGQVLRTAVTLSGAGWPGPHIGQP